jgi:hypothetical protein
MNIDLYGCEMVSFCRLFHTNFIFKQSIGHIPGASLMMALMLDLSEEGLLKLFSTTSRPKVRSNSLFKFSISASSISLISPP